MLNKISGWFLFLQLIYLAIFVVLALLLASSQFMGQAFASARSAIGLPNPFFRLSDYVSYPLVCSAPLNIGLAVAFFWRQLRHNPTLSLSSDFFSILNAVYIAASGWVLFFGFFNLCHR